MLLKQIAAGLGLTMALSSTAFAASEIVFDPDGGGGLAGDTNIGFFDWLPGSAITIGVIPTATGDFETFAHATLLGAGDGIGDPVGLPGLGTSYEITFVAGFSEGISSVSNSAATLANDGGAPGGGDDIYTFTQSITLGNPGTETVNFFEIYWDDSRDASSLAGTGFNDGTLIAAGTVSNVSGNFTTQFTFVDADDNGVFSPGGGDTIIGSGTPEGGFALLDQSPNGDDWGGQQSVTGVGATALTADVTFQDNAFFKSNISSLVMDLEFNTSNILPFQQTNPSQSFYDGTAQQNFDVGEVNGLNGPDIVFQSDANNSFRTEVPEPKTVLLLALGLLLLGATTRRRQAEQLVA